MRVAVHQPNFSPWLGYFHKINSADVFVILDNVDIVMGTSKAITNRTKILTSQGELWLTVPIKKGSSKKINDIEIDNAQNWKIKHLKTLDLTYRKAPFFKSTFDWIESIYAKNFENLSELNCNIINDVCSKLNIKSSIVYASQLNITSNDKNDRIIEICKTQNATVYLSGNGAKKYNDENKYLANKIELAYTSFTSPAYKQFNSDNFCNGLSIIDVLMNNSNDAVVSILKQ